MTIDKQEIKALVDRVKTDRRFCADENHHVLADGVLALLAEIERLAADEQEATALCSRLSDLLRDVALAVRGPEEPLKRHGFADLPSRVKAVVAERDQLKAENEDYKSGQDRYEQIIEDLKAENEALRSGRAINRLTCAEVREVFNQAYYQPREIGSDGEQCRAGVLAVIDAAMAKEASHD